MMEEQDVDLAYKLYKSIFIVLVSLMIVLGCTGYQFWVQSLDSLDAQNKDEISIQILKGSSLRDISRQLEKEGIIKSAFVFNYYTRFETDDPFFYGQYQLSPSMTTQEIIKQLQRQS